MNNRFPLAVLFLTIFIDLLGFGIVIPILPNYATEIGASEATVGLMLACFSVFQFLFGPVWGTLSDKIGRRPVLLISILLTSGAYVMLGFSNTIALLFVARAISGIGSANIAAATAYIADISNPENRAKNMGLIGAAFGLGFIFGPVIGGYVKAQYDWLGVGIACASLCLINFTMAWFMLPESLKEKNKNAKFEFKPITGIINVLKIPTIKQLFWISFIFIVAFVLMQATSSLLWEQHYGQNEMQRGNIFSFIGICTALVQGFLVGPLNKKFGEKNLLVYGLILMSIGIFGLPFVPREHFLQLEFFFLFLIALANGCVSPSILSLISQNTSPSEQGKTLGLNQSFSSLARVVGPVTGGVLYQMNYRAPYIFGALLALGAIGVCIILFKKLTAVTVRP